MTEARVSEPERRRRWRLVLGGHEADGTGVSLAGDDARMDTALALVYDRRVDGYGETLTRGRGRGRRGGLGGSAPALTRWLGDIRRYFPAPVVEVLQRDALERLDLRRLLLEPELLASVEPDVHLVALLVELRRSLPDDTVDTARFVVQRVLDDLERRVAPPTRRAVHGALSRSSRRRRPPPADIDWQRTIQANLRHWLPEHRTVVPERLVGYGRVQRSLARDVVIAVDQSGSMADSVVHAALLASVLARLPSLRTHLVAFDTSVTDLTPWLHDPVDVLFGMQLGGGTDIGRAMAYCAGLVTRPSETVLVLISDLFEGGDRGLLRTRIAQLAHAGVQVVCLLSLSDEGAPAHDHAIAAELAALGATVAACTPGEFPDVFAQALENRSTSLR